MKNDLVREDKMEEWLRAAVRNGGDLPWMPCRWCGDVWPAVATPALYSAGRAPPRPTSSPRPRACSSYTRYRSLCSSTSTATDNDSIIHDNNRLFYLRTYHPLLYCIVLESCTVTYYRLPPLSVIGKHKMRFLNRKPLNYVGY